MIALILDTNIVSILFNRKHTLRQTCVDAVAGHQLVFSFMTRSELMLWPEANNWGAQRRGALDRHMALYLTLYPDERTCVL
jgi:predicted nucleic acid-binding protein